MDIQELIRDTWQTSLVFISLLIFARFLGKTQIGQLTFYEYVSGITIGSIAANIAAAEPDKVWNHYYDLLLFVLLTYLLSQITIRSRPLRKLIDGAPTLVIENGRILENNMKQMRYDLDELTCQLRINGVLDPSEVQFAIVETTGDLSVIKKADYQPVTKKEFGVEQAGVQYPIELIMDGEIIAENLQNNNLSEVWLNEQLSIQGISHASQVTYAVIDSQGKLFISPRTQSEYIH
ncbi:DUF421 domain-containing protein [Dendrosporobacter sp. 1207_IL3150]|uniref:DUF421 domain-containing protein n=1 Tax=Dendrosporobacter sp. 1207_IL3150 TaxID=3084054 RepID=UPI002FDB848C